MTYVTITDDPVYLTEPLVKTTNMLQNPRPLRRNSCSIRVPPSLKSPTNLAAPSRTTCRVKIHFCRSLPPGRSCLAKRRAAERPRCIPSSRQPCENSLNALFLKSARPCRFRPQVPVRGPGRKSVRAMRKLLILNIAALAMTAMLAVLIVGPRAAPVHPSTISGLTDEINQANTIRKELLVMGDSMRGYLLDSDAAARVGRQDGRRRRARESGRGAAGWNDRSPGAGRWRKRSASSTRSNSIPPRTVCSRPPRPTVERATTLYFSEYLPIRQKQMAQVDALLTEVQQATTEQAAQEIQSLDSVERIVFWFAGGGLVLCVIAWRLGLACDGVGHASRIEASVRSAHDRDAAGRVSGRARSQVRRSRCRRDRRSRRRRSRKRQRRWRRWPR